MTDITKCTGEGCALKQTCYRFTAPMGTYQSMFVEVPIRMMIKKEGRKAFMSLISGYNEPFKVRYEGSAVWHTYNLKKFKELFNPTQDEQQR